MKSRFWAFTEACDEARSPRAVRDMLAAALRPIGIETYAVMTHGAPADLRSLGVYLHNWPPEAVGLLWKSGAARGNPLFDALEQTTQLVAWSTIQRREGCSKADRLWFDNLRARLGGGVGVSRALRSTLVSASCSITTADALDPESLRLCLRIANYAYQQALYLQRPRLNEAETLTRRELEALRRATVLGERPSDVAARLGVKVSTVRTLRQKASVRLDASSPEQAAWRLLETGQLFRVGRTGRPRSR